MLPISSAQFASVSRLLGRPPRGLEEIAVARADGQAMVIRVASLVEGKPFPTLFWLVDPDLNYRIDQLEAGGLIAELQAQVDAGLALQEQLVADHRAHISLRDSHMCAEVRSRLLELGYWDALQQRGIGGIGRFDRIRCLHTWYAAHLVQSNTIGRMLDEFWDRPGN